jgi:hypothetical protein
MRLPSHITCSKKNSLSPSTDGLCQAAKGIYQLPKRWRSTSISSAECRRHGDNDIAVGFLLVLTFVVCQIKGAGVDHIIEVCVTCNCFGRPLSYPVSRLGERGRCRTRLMQLDMVV